MKKLTVLAVILLSSIMTYAQDLDDRTMNIVEETMRSGIILFGMYLVGAFILVIFRKILDNRLKHRMLDKGITEEPATHLLPAEPKDVKAQTMKWFITFLSVGAGFFFINIFRPIGLHSVAILCFCIAFGYLAYYLFLRKTESK